MTLSQ